MTCDYDEEEETEHVMLIDVLFSLLLAALFTIVFYTGMKRIGPWSSYVIFYLIVFVAAWAGSRWLPQLGKSVLGIYWLSFFIPAFVFALLLFGMETGRRGWMRERGQVEHERREKEAVFRFLWRVILVALIIAVVLGYL